ncbi:hypothetical protein GE061_012352 [Apolygus lucorum]|uniref:Gamma-tubulin complex component n=1 Tax=Apolygus lucorum TaxID=248454 RepID=A0A8S9XUS3_APOLU|nr:hypothetical protein GE061_012352 [Apolygus lucorum]
MAGAKLSHDNSWAVSTVMTRQNFIPASSPDDPMILALIPWWDMGNHDNAQLTTDYNIEADRSEYRTCRDFSSGEQVFMSYGKRPNSELFLHNGFVHVDNQSDGVKLRLGVSKSDPLVALRCGLLKELCIPSSAEFLLPASVRPFHPHGKFFAFLRIFNMDQAGLEEWTKNENKEDLMLPDLTLPVDTKVWRFLSTRIKLLLAAYPTTLKILWALQQHVAGNSSCNDERMEVDVFSDSVKIYKQQFSELIQHLEHVHNFIETVETSTSKTKSSDDPPSDKTSGLYKQAFCSGIKEVLSNFSPLFIEIEDLILSDEHFSVISMATKVHPLAQVVRALKEAVVELESKEIVGCQVLDVCKHYCQSSMPSVESAFKIVYKTCLKPFFLQTNFWLLRAELYDPFNEYFISASESDVAYDSGSIAASSVSSLDALDYSKAGCYKIVLEKLPFFIPYSIAKKVLFVGESLIMCQQDPARKVELLEDRREKILESCGLGPFDVLNKMQQLEDCEMLNVDSFDSVISDIFNGVNRYARQLAEEVADVRGQLVLMRDLYLLGRGELFQEFILRAKSYLNRPAQKAKVRCLKTFFADAFYYVYLTDDSEILDAVSFTFPVKDVIPHGASILDCLNLEVKIKWPLDTIFSPDVMSCFRKLFRFLLKLKKAQITLSNVWLEMNCTNDHFNGSVLHKMTFLRNKLSAFVGNLQSYCFTDVIEDEMQELLRIVDNSNTYTAIQYAVGVFQSNVLEKLFLNLGANEDYLPLGYDTLDCTDVTVNTTQNSKGSRADKSKQRTMRDLKSKSYALPERSIREQKTRSLVFSEKAVLLKGTQEDLNLEMQKIFAEIFSSCLNLGKCAAHLKSVQDSQLGEIEMKTNAAIETLYLLSKTYDDNGHLPAFLFRLDFNGFFRNNFDSILL